MNSTPTPSPALGDHSRTSLPRFQKEILECLEISDQNIIQESEVFQALRDFSSSLQAFQQSQVFYREGREFLTRLSAVLTPPETQRDCVFAREPKLMRSYERFISLLPPYMQPSIESRIREEDLALAFITSSYFPQLRVKGKNKIENVTYHTKASNQEPLNGGFFSCHEHLGELTHKEMIDFVGQYRSYVALQLFWGSLIKGKGPEIQDLLWTEIEKTKILYMTFLDPRIFPPDEFCQKTSHFLNLRFLSLTHTDLRHFEKDSLKTFFSSAHQLKGIEFSGCFLGKGVTKEVFHELTQGITPLTSLMIRNDSLDQLTSESLVTLFSHAVSLKSLGLINVGLSKMSQEQLKAIFDSVPRLASLTIDEHDLQMLPPSHLKIIFSHNPHLKRLDFNLSHLQDISIESEEIITRNLSQLEYFYLRKMPNGFFTRSPHLQEIYNDGAFT